jgi:hypothetical protein
LRVYPSKEAILARFRPVPDQPVLGYIAGHIAATSVREADGGWTWKWDPAIFRRQVPPTLLTRLDCRVALFRAEHGMVSTEMSDVMYDRLGRVAPVIEIPAAGHHVMLDQPIALVAAIRTLLSDWDHSLPAAVTRGEQREADCRTPVRNCRLPRSWDHPGRRSFHPVGGQDQQHNVCNGRHDASSGNPG